MQDGSGRFSEAITLSKDTVMCEGDGVSGHPAVFLNLAPKGHTVCPYCSQSFQTIAYANNEGATS